MPFWVHSFKNRCIKERQQAHERDVTIAKAALAGWQFKKVAIPRHAYFNEQRGWTRNNAVNGDPAYDERYCYALYDSAGLSHGTNPTLYGAACYALAVMNLWNEKYDPDSAGNHHLSAVDAAERCQQNLRRFSNSAGRRPKL